MLRMGVEGVVGLMGMMQEHPKYTDSASGSYSKRE